MRKISLLIWAVLIMVPSFFNQTVTAQTNLVVNPGFETGRPGGPGDWWSQTCDAAHQSWAIGIGTANAHNGKQAWGVGNDGGNAGGWGKNTQNLQIPAPNPGDTFTFTMWMKGENNFSGTAKLTLEFYNGDVLLSAFSSPTHTGRFDWIEERVTAIAPRGTTTVKVNAVSENMPVGIGGSFVWFDDGYVKKVLLR